MICNRGKVINAIEVRDNLQNDIIILPNTIQRGEKKK